ncbi:MULTISPECIES: YceI family protein [Streptosporangium]|uniref:Polyisoprenoid-binding protein YceI n=1 Tax=Streptosporangium brasiliense TaxID=47480 RepID=A0ABT9RJ35_9ACTN|nr:YceI family protein [Streptosporangium brasiliense]MDP9868325.1 polyisoprenoid-binding protein YceI [Streptosporangium brasiliense]
MTSKTTTTAMTALPLHAGHWTLDPLHSAVGFTIRHLGISKVRGHFGRFAADLTVGDTLDGCTVSATVALDSIDTGNADRDAHVSGPDMLDVANRPVMAFRSTRIDGAGDEWTMEGDLTIGEVTRAVAFDVEFGGVEDSIVDGRRHVGFEAKGEIRRSDFGLGFAPAILGDSVRIQLDMQFVEPE